MKGTLRTEISVTGISIFTWVMFMGDWSPYFTYEQELNLISTLLRGLEFLIETEYKNSSSLWGQGTMFVLREPIFGKY